MTIFITELVQTSRLFAFEICVDPFQFMYTVFFAGVFRFIELQVKNFIKILPLPPLSLEPRDSTYILGITLHYNQTRNSYIMNYKI